MPLFKSVKSWMMICLILPLLIQSCSDNDRSQQPDKRTIKKQASAKSTSIPADRTILTQKAVDQNYYHWLKRTIPDWYQKTVDQSDRFNPDIHTFLNHVCKYQSDQPDKQSKKELLASAQALIEGNSPALFLICYSQVLYDDEQYKKARQLVETAINDLDPDTHLKIHFYFARQLLNRLHARQKTGKYSKQNYWEKLAADSIAQAIDNGTPLLLALQNHKVKTAVFLLDRGADVNMTDLNNWTPLHLAIHGTHKEITTRLLDMDIDMNALNDQNFSPLSMALDNNQPDIAWRLLKNGADTKTMDNEGFTPFEIARKNNHSEMMTLLTDSE